MHVLDLFCGAAGGWSKGLATAGYTTVAACEIDDWRSAVFAASHPGCVMYANIRDLTADHLIRDLGYLPDVVVGSPPCQEISAANTKGEGITDDHLFWEWARLVFEVRPLWCAAENSPRARTQGIDGILDALDQGGYASWATVVGADNAGANHRRKRLWLIAADAERLGEDASDTKSAERRAHGAAEFGMAGQHAVPQRQEGAGGDRARLWEDGADAQGLGQPRPMGCAAGRTQERDRPAGNDLPDARHAAEFERLRQRRVRTGSSTEPAQADLRDAPHPDREGLAIGPRIPRHHGQELPTALRDMGLAWPHWNGGLPGLAAACAAAGFGAVDDGPDHGLPASLRNRAIAALGDAIVPQIPYAIGCAMMEAFA